MKSANELAAIAKAARDAAAAAKAAEAEVTATDFVQQVLQPEAQNGKTQVTLPAGVTFGEGVEEALATAGYRVFRNKFHVTFVAWG